MDNRTDHISVKGGVRCPPLTHFSVLVIQTALYNPPMLKLEQIGLFNEKVWII